FPDVMRQTGQRLGQKMLQSDRQYTAMIGVNDALALGVSDTLTQAGLRVPQDVALIGFDDSTEAMAEGLTSIAPLWENTAKAAAQLLARIIVQPQPDYTHMVLSKPHLILRSSTTGQSRGIKTIQTTTQLLD
ncbi:MAG: substrate-binding domain-containing protein, partial [Phycisphaeraceae bacterium]|nr:substrate-binding domain-containing protein [Phycisphaeraceae bacterium]